MNWCHKFSQAKPMALPFPNPDTGEYGIELIDRYMTPEIAAEEAKKNVSFLGAGGCGIACETRNPNVVRKYTTEDDEARTAKFLMNNPIPCFAKVYTVDHLQQNGKYDNLWAIDLERLQKLTRVEARIFDEYKIALRKAVSTDNFNSVIRAYLNIHPNDEEFSKMVYAMVSLFSCLRNFSFWSSDLKSSNTGWRDDQLVILDLGCTIYDEEKCQKMLSLSKNAQANIPIDYGDYENNVREYYRDLVDWCNNNPDKSLGGCTYEQAEEWIRQVVLQTQKNMNMVATKIQQVISSISWSGSSVIIKVGSPPIEWGNKPDWSKPVTSASIQVGKGAYNYAPDFTLFLEDENWKMDIDDILEAGDEDFFSDPREQQDYFNLVRAIKYPASLQSNKILTLYTARPIKDRHRYLDTNSVPANIFLTNSYSHASGLAQDLPGGVRDIWKVRVPEKSVFITEDFGSIKNYQVLGSGDVPVASIKLIDAGDQL